MVNQDQTKCAWSNPGQAYGVDCVSHSTGIQYADYFHINCHNRLESFEENKTKLIIIANIVWDKSTFLKSTIESETMNGLEKYYEVFKQEVNESFYKSLESEIQNSKNNLSICIQSGAMANNFDERPILLVLFFIIITQYLLCLITRV